MTQNASIREKKWSKSKFENFALPLGPWVPDLSHSLPIFKNEVLFDFSDFGWLDMLGIAYYGSTDCYKLLTSINYLAGWYDDGKSG